jgi:HAD superfamily hydrolase (TIGR01509 family)
VDRALAESPLKPGESVALLIRSLLIDFDGTIVDSIRSLRRVHSDFVSAHGGIATDSEFDALNGVSLHDIVRYLAKVHCAAGPIEDLQRDYERRLEEAYEHSVELMPGARDLLRWSEQNGLRVAVVTACPSRFVAMALTRLGLLEAVDEIVGGDTTGRGKPHPDLYLEALRRLDESPEKALALEDSASGVRAACAANVRCIAVNAGGDGINLLEAGALRVERTLETVPSVIENTLLRRPLVVVPARRLDVHTIDGAFEPSAVVAGRVATLWSAMTSERPALHDGLVFGLVDYSRDAVSVDVRVREVHYRHVFAGQRGIDVGVTSVGVSGITYVRADPPGTRAFVFGRRSQTVSQYAGSWELAPSGGLSTRHAHGGHVDAESQLREELAEELGEEFSTQARVYPIGVVLDVDATVVDLCYAIEVDVPAGSLVERLRANAEYVDLAVIHETLVPSFLEENHERLVPTVMPLFRLLEAATSHV